MIKDLPRKPKPNPLEFDPFENQGEFSEFERAVLELNPIVSPFEVTDEMLREFEGR